MGNANKWIKKFLTKKKEKEKKKEGWFSADYFATGEAILPAETPNGKRRWSFGRSTNTDAITRRINSRSLDSILSTHLITQAFLECQNEQTHLTAVIVAENEQAIRTAVATIKSGFVENAAAVTIQAAFRSYLAKKALRALRGLVKIQALVRGHLVRKQTTATIHCMQALMAIQSRARVQRIHMAEKLAQPLTKRRTNSNISRHAIEKSMEDEYDNYYNHGRFSISERESYSPAYAYTSPSQSTIMIPRRKYTAVHKANRNQVKASSPSTPIFHNESEVPIALEPNYMANTQCSKAKLRSQSEPKQRPNWITKQESRPTASKVENNAGKNGNPCLIDDYKFIEESPFPTTNTNFISRRSLNEYVEDLFFQRVEEGNRKSVLDRKCTQER